MNGTGRRTSKARRLAGGLLAACLIAAAATGAHAASGSDVFTIANYPVEARAKDAVMAKEQALADGQQAALRSLLRRLVPVTSYGRLKSMSSLKAADFLDGVSVRTERNSSTDYIATLDFSFQAAAVRTALNRSGIPFVDDQAPQTVVIPLARGKASAELSGGSGAWFESWSGLDLTHTLTPVKLENLKPGIGGDAVRAVIDAPAKLGQIFTAEYKTDRIILALAEPDAAGTKLIVTMAGADAAGPFSLKRSYKISGGDIAYTQELAAVVGLGILEGRWKAIKAGANGGVDTANGSGVLIVAEFASLSEWNEIRTRILDTDGAFDVSIGSVSARSAEVTLRHNGGVESLVQAFAAHGLTLDNVAGSWRVRSTF